MSLVLDPDTVMNLRLENDDTACNVINLVALHVLGASADVGAGAYVKLQVERSIARTENRLIEMKRSLVR